MSVGLAKDPPLPLVDKESQILRPPPIALNDHIGHLRWGQAKDWVCRKRSTLKEIEVAEEIELASPR